MGHHPDWQGGAARGFPVPPLENQRLRVGSGRAACPHLETQCRRLQKGLGPPCPVPLLRPAGSQAAGCLSDSAGLFHHRSSVPRVHSMLSALEMEKNGLLSP